MNATRKTRPDDVLGNLPLAQREQILAWLSEHSYASVQRHLSAPAPHGCGLDVSVTSLQRFYVKHLPAQLRREREQSLAEFKETAASLKAEPHPYFVLARELIEQHVLALSGSPNGNEDRLVKLTDLLLRIRSQELRERDLARKLDAISRSRSPEASTPVTPVIDAPAREVNENPVAAEQPGNNEESATSATAPTTNSHERSATSFKPQSGFSANPHEVSDIHAFTR
ncbi:MAG TPA: hypothetical protein VEH27_12390 [Methylomirabilota bacterium]|nr:hypothetical protein [Methylomirabilota bacterium]